MTRQKFSAILSLLLSSLFLLFMVLGMVATITKDKTRYSFFENRLLAAPPQYTTEGVLDGSYFSDIETYIKDYAAGRTTLLKADTLINLKFLKRPIVNDIVIGENILLPKNNYEIVNTPMIEQQADIIASNLRIHADTAQSYGGHFYYVAVPNQYACNEEKYPSYLNNRAEYTTTASSALFSRLQEKKINYIDMREVYLQNNKPACFTSTVDNHYGIEGGYLTYRAIMDRLQKDTDLPLSVLEEGEYTKTTLPNPYLGSRNRKLFGMWNTEEHLSVITPNEDIPFTRTNNGTPVKSTVYNLPQNEWDAVLYGLYMDGDIAETTIETKREELPDILIYGDSFTNAVECVLWYSCNTMRSVDLRHYKDMTIDQYILECKPDVVICLRDYGALLLNEGNGK